jgi:hypothetical protein
MSRKSNLGLFVLCLFSALPAIAQLDSAALRVKFGEPLHREVFHLPQGFDLIVDYGAGNQVCKLQVPADPPPPPNTSGAFNGRQQMQDFLADLVPDSIRGKELSRHSEQLGLASISVVEYEHLTIDQFYHPESPQGGTISVRFKNKACKP